MPGKLNRLNTAAQSSDTGSELGQTVMKCQWKLRLRVKTSSKTWPKEAVAVLLEGDGGAQSLMTRMLSPTSAEVVFTGSGPQNFEALAEAGTLWSLVAPQTVAVKNGDNKLVELEIKPLKTWVGIQLVDLAGQPVPDRPYRVRLPDGRTMEGKLDKQGTAKFPDLDPGQCEVTFPGLDEEAWGPLG